MPKDLAIERWLTVIAQILHCVQDDILLRLSHASGYSVGLDKVLATEYEEWHLENERRERLGVDSDGLESC